MKIFSVDAFDNEEQVPALNRHSGFLTDFAFNSLGKQFLAVLTAAGQNIPFFSAVTSFYCKQSASLDDNCLCRCAYLS